MKRVRSSHESVPQVGIGFGKAIQKLLYGYAALLGDTNRVYQAGYGPVGFVTPKSFRVNTQCTRESRTISVPGSLPHLTDSVPYVNKH